MMITGEGGRFTAASAWTRCRAGVSRSVKQETAALMVVPQLSAA
jgi:hypothetical protein